MVESLDYSWVFQSVGQELQPLWVVDDFVPQAQSLIEYAIQRGEVSEAAGLYPGLRSPAPEAYAVYVQEKVTELIQQSLRQKAGFVATEAFFSLVALTPEQLKVPQRLPHFDRPRPQDYAVVHYLCKGEHGGTGFYRHRSSGFEYIDTSRHDRYLQLLDSELAGSSSLPTGYINGDNQWFERIASVDAKFNRAVIYRCSSLHSGNIPGNYQANYDPYAGRFTLTSFLTAGD